MLLHINKNESRICRRQKIRQRPPVGNVVVFVAQSGSLCNPVKFPVCSRIQSPQDYPITERITIFRTFTNPNLKTCALFYLLFAHSTRDRTASTRPGTSILKSYFLILHMRTNHSMFVNKLACPLYMPTGRKYLTKIVF